MRCYHESQLHDRNCFLTLTYNDENLPSDGSLDIRHMQLFLKRLRRNIGSGVKVFYCGEYGEQRERPHYHALMFNYDFGDKKLWTIRRGNPLYTSEALEEAWQLGYCSVGALTYQSAGYVARYIMKKVTGGSSSAHYQGRKPEFVQAGKRPAVGARWIQRYWEEVYPRDYVTIEKKKIKPPRFYDLWMREHQMEVFREVLQKRRAFSELTAADNTSERLEVREEVQIARMTRLRREL